MLYNYAVFYKVLQVSNLIWALQYILAEEGSEDIVREKISVSSGIDKFNDSVVDATDTGTLHFDIYQS